MKSPGEQLENNENREKEMRKGLKLCSMKNQLNIKEGSNGETDKQKWQMTCRIL